MPRILLVDDDIAEISAVKRVLAKSGLTPVLATNASDARVAVAHRRPDMLIVGATCEGGEAVALAVQLAGKPATRDLPIIVLGASEAAPPRAVVLPRPVDPFALSEQVVDLLARPKPAAPPSPPASQGPVLERVEYRAPRPPVIVPEYLEAAEADLTPIETPRYEEPLYEAPPLEPALLEEPSADRPALERRGTPISLPQALERRSTPSDPANARKAAVEALRARAEELRRGPEPSGDPAPAEAAAGLDALFELQPPAGVDAVDGAAVETTAPDDVQDLDPAWLLPLSDEVTPLTPLHSEHEAEPVPVPARAPEDFSGLFDDVEPAPSGPAPLFGGREIELEPPQGVTTTLSEGTGADELRGPTGTLPGFEAPGAPRSRRMVDELEAQARAQAALEDEVQARLAREAEAQALARAAEEAEAEAHRAREAEAAALARARVEAAALEQARAEARALAEQEAARARQAALAEAIQARQEIEAEAERVRRVAEAEAARARQSAELEAERARQAEERAAAEADRAHQAEERLRAEAAARSEALERAGLEAERARRAEQAARAEIEAAARQAQEAAHREAQAAARLAQASAERELEVVARRAQEAEVLLRAASVASSEATRLAEVEAQRAHQAEERLRAEAAAHAEALQQAGEEAARARLAEQATQREAEARRLLETEIERLRAQREADLAAHLAELERARAGAVEDAAQVEARRAEAQRLAVGAAAEAAASRASSDAEARGREALEAAQIRLEAETTARAVAEEARKHAEETLRRLAEERLADAAASPPRTSERPAPRPVRLSDPSGAPWPEAPPAWTEPYAPAGAPVLPEPLPVPAEGEPLPLPPAELRSGHLDDLAFPRWLWLAARAQVTGRLDVAGEAARSLWFEAGKLMGAASNVPAERVEEVALRLGLLTREQHRSIAGAAAALPPRRAAVLLVERGYLKPAELTALVRRRTEEVAFGIFSEVGARFRWAPDPVPPDERVAPERPLLALALEGVRRRWQTPRLEAVLGGPDALLAPAPGGPDDAAVGLSADDRRCLALADGLRTADELVALSPLDPLSTRQLLAFAVLVKRLEPRLVQVGRPRGQVAAAIDLARLQAKLEQVRRDDYFTILGVGRLCTPHEVREAADRILDDLSPERFEGRRDEGLTAKLQEIQHVVAEARAVLVDDGLRSEYLRGIGG